jgi:hypothetical protein
VGAWGELWSSVSLRHVPGLLRRHARPEAFRHFQGLRQAQVSLRKQLRRVIGRQLHCQACLEKILRKFKARQDHLIHRSPKLFHKSKQVSVAFPPLQQSFHGMEAEGVSQKPGA